MRGRPTLLSSGISLMRESNMIKNRVCISLHGFLLAVVLVSLLVSVFPGSIATADTIVNFPDPGLQQAIREAIGKPTGDIYQSDLAGLTTLEAIQRGITDLTGIEWCTNLTELDLQGNRLADISKLSDLTNLTWLALGGNDIGNVSSLSNLDNLTLLSICGGKVSDVSPLSSLINLSTLGLDYNNVSNFSPITSLPNLEHLYLGGNHITDISSIGTLGNLTWLHLQDNSISDISILSSLTNLEQLYIYNNQISDISALAGLIGMKWLALGNNQISDVSPLSGLTNLFRVGLENNNISDISSLVGLINLDDNFGWVAPPFEADLDLSGNQINDIYPLVQNSGIGSGDTVDLRDNPLSVMSISTYITQLEQRGAVVLWELSPTPTPTPTPTTDVTGITREVNGDILSGVSIVLDGIGPVVSDQDGQFQILATSTGIKNIVAHKDGFRDRTQTINIAGLGEAYAVTCNFQAQHGLIPCAPDIWYALDCVNRWLYPPNPDTGLDIWTALDVINAWLYPVQ
jgi:Leucine-rich repeat (LRR) protein